MGRRQEPHGPSKKSTRSPRVSTWKMASRAARIRPTYRGGSHATRQAKIAHCNCIDAQHCNRISKNLRNLLPGSSGARWQGESLGRIQGIFRTDSRVMVPPFLPGRTAAAPGREKRSPRQTHGAAGETTKLVTQVPPPGRLGPTQTQKVRDKWPPRRGLPMQRASGHHRKSLWISQDSKRKHIMHSDQEIQGGFDKDYFTEMSAGCRGKGERSNPEA